MIVAAILAGGQSRRFGTDKALADLGGAPMIVCVGEALRAGAGALAVVGHARGAALLKATSLCDPPLSVHGPLLGVLAALEWGRELGADYVVTAPCDVPRLPRTFTSDITAAARAQNASAAMAVAEGEIHPLCAAWSPSLAPTLRAKLEAGEHPRAQSWVESALQVTFEDATAFANVNTIAELARLKLT